MKKFGGLPQHHQWGLSVGYLICATHAILVCLTFPLSELFSGVPALYIDSPFHLYQTAVAKELWGNHFRLIGFDPWFAAGHIGGVNYNASAKFPALLAALLSQYLSPVIAYKLYTFCSALLAPSFILLAARLMKVETVASITATLFGFLMWWISAFHWYHTAGMVSYVAASYAAIPYIALAWRSISEPLTPLIILALGVLGAIGVLYHPLFPIPVIFAMTFLTLVAWNQVIARQLIVILLIVPSLCLLPNAFWIIPAVKYPGWSDGSLSPYQKLVDIGILWSEALGRVEGSARGAKINPILWFCAAWSLSTFLNPPLRRISAGFIASAGALMLFAALGAWWHVTATLQPNRLSAAAYLLLVFPAALGITAITRAISTQGYGRFMAQVSAGLLLVATVFFASEIKKEVSSDDIPHYGKPSPEVRGPGDITSWITQWIKDNTTDSARVLFETSSGRIYDNAHVAGYIALETRREFIGGPYVFMHYADFWDGRVFGKLISEFSVTSFMDQLKLYNIGWIVIHSKVSSEYLSHHPALVQVAQRGQFKIFKVNQTHSYFLEGNGKVRHRQLNQIDLEEVEGRSIILKYHYVEGMVADPPATLLPIAIPGDPQPFIRVLAPSHRMSILLP